MPPASLGPPPDTAAAYYPLDAGWKWAYRIDKGGDNILATYAVTDRGGDTAIIQAGEERLMYAILPEGIARRNGLNLGDFLLKTPIKKGASWDVEGGRAVVVDVGHSLTVPAGTFPQCATVEETRNNPARVVRTSYAPGVGPVSIEYQVHNPLTGQFEVALKASLQGMTRPGQDPLQ
jgi:hypothetical protein